MGSVKFVFVVALLGILFSAGQVEATGSAASVALFFGSCALFILNMKAAEGKICRKRRRRKVRFREPERRRCA